MRCVHCTSATTNVTDTRTVKGVVRRRRVCKRCGKSFFTVEVLERGNALSPELAKSYQDKFAKRVHQAALRILQATTEIDALKEMISHD